MTLSGDRPWKRGRMVGRQALTTARDASTRDQYIVGAVLTGFR